MEGYLLEVKYVQGIEDLIEQGVDPMEVPIKVLAEACKSTKEKVYKYLPDILECVRHIELRNRD